MGRQGGQPPAPHGDGENAAHYPPSAAANVNAAAGKPMSDPNFYGPRICFLVLFVYIVVFHGPHL